MKVPQHPHQIEAPEAFFFDLSKHHLQPTKNIIFDLIWRYFAKMIAETMRKYCKKLVLLKRYANFAQTC